MQDLQVGSKSTITVIINLKCFFRRTVMAKSVRPPSKFLIFKDVAFVVVGK